MQEGKEFGKEFGDRNLGTEKKIKLEYDSYNPRASGNWLSLTTRKHGDFLRKKRLKIFSL